jgi:NADH:ubiquinone oxidoreductase subunit F (NADH-binding)
VSSLCRVGASERRGEDLDQLVSLSRALRDASLCPLGQSPILPIERALRHFRDEFLTCTVPS